MEKGQKKTQIKSAHMRIIKSNNFRKIEILSLQNKKVFEYFKCHIISLTGGFRITNTVKCVCISSLSLCFKPR